MKLICLLLLFLTSLFCKAQEKVFFNAKIFTANPQKPFADAIAIKGNIIYAVGNLNEAKRSVSVNAEWIDVKGGFLMPGLIDTHNHGIDGGIGLTKANLSDQLLSVAEIHTYAKEVLKSKEGMSGDVLIIYGINISTWESLDQISKNFNSGEFENQPLILRGSDYHTSFCNKAMMKKAGINKAYIQTLKQEEQNYFEKDSEGEPSGFITENGYRKVESALVVESDFSKAAEKTMLYNNMFGITAWLDPSVTSLKSSSRNMLDWYRYLSNTGKLSAHIAATVVADINSDPQTQIDKVKMLQKKYSYTDFTIIGFKVFADGVIEFPTHTAALSIAYTGTQSKGDLMMDPKKFADFSTMADKNNLLVHVHAIGDRAVTETLNGFEEARKINRNSRIPHTITHLQIVKPSDFARFAQLNVLTSFQLFWAFGDATTIDIVKPYIDPALYKWQYPVRSLLQAGATITGASDWPVSTANPFEAISRAETRKGPMGVLDSTQCMPRMTMLYAYTSEAAKALLLEKKIGSLEPGKYADLILLDRDILTITPDSLMNTRVLWTMFEGRKVYDAENKK